MNPEQAMFVEIRRDTLSDVLEEKTPLSLPPMTPSTYVEGGRETVRCSNVAKLLVAALDALAGNDIGRVASSLREALGLIDHR